jgi:hypothetical protein
MSMKPASTPRMSLVLYSSPPARDNGHGRAQRRAPQEPAPPQLRQHRCARWPSPAHNLTSRPKVHEPAEREQIGGSGCGDRRADDTEDQELAVVGASTVPPGGERLMLSNESCVVSRQRSSPNRSRLVPPVPEQG